MCLKLTSFPHNAENSMFHTINCQVPSYLNRSIAVLTPKKVRSIPEIILSCLVALTVVHLDSTNRDVPKFHRLALETKAAAYKGFGDALQRFPDLACDHVYCCFALIFCINVSTVSCTSTISLWFQSLSSDSPFV